MPKIFMKKSFSQICFMSNFGATGLDKLQLKFTRLHCRTKMVKNCENWQFWPISCTYLVMFYSPNAKKAFIWTSLSVLIITILANFSLHIWSYNCSPNDKQAFIWTKLGVLMVGHKWSWSSCVDLVANYGKGQKWHFWCSICPNMIFS